MDRIIKLFATTAVVMTVLFSVVTPTSASAAPADVSVELTEIAHGEPCSPIVGLASLVPTVVPGAVAPPAVQQEEEGDDDEEEFDLSCDVEAQVDSSYKKGVLTVTTCARPGETVSCTITSGSGDDENEIKIKLKGCIEIEYERKKD